MLVFDADPVTVVVQQVSDGWTIAAAIGALLSAIATAISAGIIAYQAVQTRKSVQQTNKALKVAKRQARLAQRSIIEGQKALIASQVPRLSVRVTEQAFDVWLYGRTGNPGDFGRVLLAPGGRVFTMPGDAQRQLELVYKIQAANDGPMRADVEIYYQVGDYSRVEKTVLLPGKVYEVEASRVETLEEWIRIAGDYDPRRTGDSGLPIEREIYRLFYSYMGEEGANEGHPVVAGGSILERDPGNASGWAVRTIASDQYAQPIAAAGVIERHYYGSRSRSEELI